MCEDFKVPQTAKVDLNGSDLALAPLVIGWEMLYKLNH